MATLRVARTSQLTLRLTNGRTGAAVLIVAVLVGMALPYLTSSYYLAIATQVLFFGLLAMSIDLLGGYLGLMPLGHAGIMGVAAYVMGFLIGKAHWAWPAALLAALLSTLVVCVIFGLLAVRTTGIFFVMITMAEGMLVWGLAYRWSSVTGAENGIRGIARPEFATLYWQYYYLVLGVFAACVVVLGRVVHSPFGLVLKGIRESESRMRTLGYNVTLHKLLAFLISGFFAGIAGVMDAWYNQFISPSAINLTASTEGILMVVLGGPGTLLGPVLGAGVIVFIKNIVSMYITRWPTIMGLIFVGVVLFAQDGILGAVRRGRLRFTRSGPVQTQGESTWDALALESTSSRSSPV